MGWLLFWAILAATLALVFFAWRKWIAPWRAIQRLANQIAHGEAPSTFLVDGGAAPQRVGLTLEKIFARLEELNRSMAGRESGTQTILRAMQDGLLVVDANRRVILANRAFRKWFGLRRIAAGEPLLDLLRNPTIERLIHDVLQVPKSQRTELSIEDRDLEISGVPIGMMPMVSPVRSFCFTTLPNCSGLIRCDAILSPMSRMNCGLHCRSCAATSRRCSINPILLARNWCGFLEVMDRHSKRLGLLVDDLLTLAQLESATPNLQLSDVNLEELLQTVVRDWQKKFAGKEIPGHRRCGARFAAHSRR